MTRKACEIVLCASRLDEAKCQPGSRYNGDNALCGLSTHDEDNGRDEIAKGQHFKIIDTYRCGETDITVALLIGFELS